MIVFEGVTKVYEPDVTALERGLVRDREGRVRLRRRRVGIGQVDARQAAAEGDRADEGRIFVGGRDLTRLKHSKVPLLRRNVGCVFQDFKLLPSRTAAENVAYALKVQGESRTSIRRKVPEVMNMVGLAHKMDSLPDELSGGEQQRVSIARAVVNHPPLLVCDEPTGNLDPDTSVGIMQLLYRINRSGTTISWSRTTARWSTRCASASSRSKTAGSCATSAAEGTRANERAHASSSPRRGRSITANSRRRSQRR